MRETFFIVTSPGYMATKWLAWSLNAHPEIYCNHSAGSDALERDYSPAELEALAREKFQDRDKRPLEDFFDELARRAGEARARGNVHRYNLTALQRNLAHWARPRPFTCLNLVRHPVSWVASGTAQLSLLYRVSPVIRGRLRRHFGDYRTRYLSLGTTPFPNPEELAFCYLCHRLLHLARESRFKGAIHRRMESLTTDPEAFGEVVTLLTGLRIDPGGSYLRKVFDRGPIHRHRQDDAQPPLDTYRAWSPWRQRIFSHWAAESRIFEHYAEHPYSRLPAPEPPPARSLARIRSKPEVPPAAGGPCPAATIRQAYRTGFDPVASRPVALNRFLEKPLRQVMARLHRELERAGLGEHLGTFPGLYLSAGLAGGAPPTLARAFFGPEKPDQWRAALCHPLMQDRSPALVCHHPSTRKFVVLNLKGAGVRSLDDTFVTRAERCPEYRETLESGRHKPFDVLIGHSETESVSHQLIGGALLLPTLIQVRNALGWHRLLFQLDDRAAATCIPVRVTQVAQVTVRSRRAGSVERRTLPTWDFLTNPAYMARGQLEQVLRNIGRWSYLCHPSGPFVVRRFRRSLDAQTLGETRHDGLRRRIGTMYLHAKGPVVYEHATRGKLRVGHVWKLVSDDDLIRREAGTSGIRTLIDITMAEFYVANGRDFATAGDLVGDLSRRSARFAYLRALYRANEERAHELMVHVGREAGRTLGALHGVGGHCMGRRLKVRDRRGRPVFDEEGLDLRIGAPGGGSTSKRNMTVCGEWVDTTHVFNPLFENVAMLSRFANRLGDRFCRWTANRHVSMFQQADLELAEESVSLFHALLTGEPESLPPELEEIDRLRERRKRREDLLRNRADGATIDGVLDLERSIQRLRQRQKDIVPSETLTRFRAAYEEYYGRATAWCAQHRRS